MLRSLVAVTLYTVVAAGLCNVARGQQTPAASAGQDAEAKGLFQAGAAAFAEGRYEDALKYFSQSYKLSNRAKLLYNIGQTADRLRRDEEALEAFEEYLKQVPDATNRVEVENRVRVLRSVIETNKAKAAEAPEQNPYAASEAAASQNPYGPSQKPVEPEATSPASQEPASAATQSTPERRDEGGGLLSKWWFWTAAGVVVAGAAAGIAIAAGSGGQQRPKPLPSNTGVVVTTLRYAP